MDRLEWFRLKPGNVINEHYNWKERGSKNGYLSVAVDFVNSFHESGFFRVLYELTVLKVHWSGWQLEAYSLQLS